MDAHALKLRVMMGRCDVTLRSHPFSEVIGIGDNLLDLLNHSLRLQNPTGDAVSEGEQSRDPDDETHESVERK